MTRYDIELIRDETGVWVGCCESVNANTQASSIRQTLKRMCESIAVSVDIETEEVEFGQIQIELDHGDDLSAMLAEALASRRTLGKVEDQTRDITRRVVAAFSEAGVSRRDVGALLGISGQRVEQLLKT